MIGRNEYWYFPSVHDSFRPDFINSRCLWTCISTHALFLGISGKVTVCCHYVVADQSLRSYYCFASLQLEGHFRPILLLQMFFPRPFPFYFSFLTSCFCQNDVSFLVKFYQPRIFWYSIEPLNDKEFFQGFNFRRLQMKLLLPWLFDTRHEGELNLVGIGK